MSNFTKLLLCVLLVVSKDFKAQIVLNPTQEMWVDSVFKSLDEDEKLGQLFMIRAYSKGDAQETNKILKLIKEYHIGGLCFFQGDPTEQATITLQYQHHADIPLLIAIDAEWGLGMRFPDKAISFPRNLTLGAIEDQNPIYDMGVAIAEQCKRMGIHVNFAPVVDVNNNINNPVIGDRSFGEDKFAVAAKAYAYIKGLQDNGIIACAKHFPGHGDTDVDSHLDLPTIRHNLERLNEIELFPFKNLVNKGVMSMMVAHLHIPAFDDRPNRPSTLSRYTVTDLLRNKMGFDGLIFTDALDMKGVAKFFTNGTAEAEALLAGNDVLLLSEDVPQAILTIKQYVKEGKIAQSQIDASVKRILAAKAFSHAADISQIHPDSLSHFLNSGKFQAVKSDLISKSLTLTKNNKSVLPFEDIGNKSFASLSVNSQIKTEFQKRLDSYAKVDHFQAFGKLDIKTKNFLISKLVNHDHIIVSFHNMSKYASKNFGLDEDYINFLKLLPKEKLIIVLFGSPYALKNFGDETILVAYQDDEMTQDLAAQALFGAIPIKGKLPITASKNHPIGQGVYVPSIHRLGFCPPEKVGLDSEVLNQIDGIAEEMIAKKAAPGCQVLVAKDGNVVFEKSYGYFDYSKSQKVENSSLYDLASLTKILSTTLSIMKLDAEAAINIDYPIRAYLPETDTTNKADLTIRQMIAHCSGLRPWIPFYENTIIKKKSHPIVSDSFYSTTINPDFAIPVASNLFLRTDYRDTIWHEILISELKDNTEYRYSDLGFYIMQHIIENASGMTLDKYFDQNFAKPLGLKNMGYNPLYSHNIGDIVPTEEDRYFRNQQLRGTVHDMGAAMLGGVAGHAGLFSNAEDIAVIMQMLLNQGSYGGKQYFPKSIVKKYTSHYILSSRRGLGFDMKECNPDKTENMCNSASKLTFGHLGFTGTATFADPQYNIVYVFLSNRTFPKMDNQLLNKLDIRPRIQQKIYDALLVNKEGV
ncbi:MAG: serine hydrolase [Saprospiraceae bacterium]|nr:serine hydrolase [Saprospiraceae bacterium]